MLCVLTRNVLKAVASVMYIMYKVLYVMLNAAGLFFAYFLLMMLRLMGKCVPIGSKVSFYAGEKFTTKSVYGRYRWQSCHYIIQVVASKMSLQVRLTKVHIFHMNFRYLRCEISPLVFVPHLFFAVQE